MKQKNIILVQVAEQFSGGSKSAYLPYAAGAVAAKAWSNPVVAASFKLEPILFLREPVHQVAGRMKDPFLAGFSCYLWNFEYHKALAAALKSKYPDCLIVFGGHHVPAGVSLLEECPFIDILVHGEGEEVFEKLLCAMANGGDLSAVPNISYRDANRVPVQRVSVPVTGTDYPSPYTMGIFDSILEAYPDMGFSAILETNRGCPNRCAFCDWGPLQCKVRMFDLSRAKSDIAWFASHKIEYIWGADANFGQYRRDLTITDWIIEAKKQNGYPCRMKVNYAKFNNANVFELAKRLSDADLSKSTTLSLQTLSQHALRNIGRQNMSMEHFSGLMKLYKNAGIPTYSEMILALPGETYDSFTGGIGSLLEAGQHAVIEIYDFVLLPNSLLAGPNARQQHQIETIRLPFVLYHCEAAEPEIIEYADIVIATRTMSLDDWVACKFFAVVVQSMHCLGLLRYVAMFLYHEKGIPYTDFYRRLAQWLISRPQTLGGEVFASIRQKLYLIRHGVNEQFFYDEACGDVLWYLDEGVFFRLIAQPERFYREITAFLEDFGLEKEIARQLLEYQRCVMRTPGNRRRRVKMNYDFHSYMLACENNEKPALRQIRNTMEVKPGKRYESLAQYAREAVWYGRRLGETLLTCSPGETAVVYDEEQPQPSS